MVASLYVFVNGIFMFELRPFVTFLIPTLGRKSLNRAITSLKLQTDSNWSAIVMFDGLSCPRSLSKKVRFLQYKKQRGAGGVRNRMLEILYKKEPLLPQWVAFLDDDDHLKETYVERLREYACKGDEVVLFSHRIKRGLIPRRGTTKIACMNVGISYAVRMDFLTRVQPLFREKKEMEDCHFVKACQNAGAKVFITHDEQYMCPGRRSRWRKPKPGEFYRNEIKLL